ncbi:MAG: aspartate/glutamate racemase family protein [Bradyrhizobium sp.]|uniref:maleate cis-trans isomerase family protein n=1 Tax=Bradyrhizobium sp. TaxID=376 RepID=UPI003D10008F
MYGWRGRIGVIVPAINTTLEPECHRLAPEGVSFHFARMPLAETSPDALVAMGKYAKEKGREVAAAGVDLIVFACTSGSFTLGKGHDEDIIRELEDATGIPAMTTSTAILKALRTLDIRSMAIASPYSDELNARQKIFFEENGITVHGMAGLGFVKQTPHFPLSARPVSHVGLQEPAVAYKLARQVHGRSPDAQAILISCTNLRTIDVIQKLERDCGKPVVTSNQATIWASLLGLSIREQRQDCGTLFTLVQIPDQPADATPNRRISR